MFDNPEKLFILFVIALMILGPSKLASLGASLGRSIRDFRSAVRGAHDEFRSAVQEHVDSLAPALPAPDPDPMPDPSASIPVNYDTVVHTPATPPAAAVVPSELEGAASAAAASEMLAEDDQSSLTSEPTAAELRRAGAL
jgi:TatA/E family protein of Tat protein translocase